MIALDATQWAALWYVGGRLCPLAPIVARSNGI